jgi:hypothetical protein
MERALALLLDRGATQDAAVVQNNLPLVRYLLEGPARALAAFEQAIAFCRERGLDHAALVCETNCPGLLAELGQTSEALDLAARLASAAQAMGESYDLIELGSVELTIRLASGERVSRAAAEELVRAARESGGIEPVVFAFAAAAAILAVDAPGDACSLLQELEETEGSREPTSYRRELAGMVRTALAAGDRTLAERLAAQFEPRYPIDEHAICAVRAQLSEHAGELGEAASLYGHAATRWQEFGHVLERAHALLGRGRCLVALGKPEAEQPLSQAREVFASVGYRLALAEADTLLARLPTAAS